MGNFVGLVLYQDDPNQAIFRTVHLTGDDKDSELDNPRWVTEGCDKNRVAVLKTMKVADYQAALRKISEAQALASVAEKSAEETADPIEKAAVLAEQVKQQEVADTLTKAVLFTGTP